MKISSLIQSIGGVQDPRRVMFGNIRHSLEAILVIGLITYICGGKDFADMETLGKSKQMWLLGFLNMPSGVPDSDTFRRVFERINPDELSRALNDWVLLSRQINAADIRNIAIDGKTARGSSTDYRKAYHIVSAWASEHGISLGQVVVDEKSNEITAIPQLLDILDIEGSVVTIDAMGCQRAIAAKIVEGKADYCIALKANQKNLYKEAVRIFKDIEDGNTEICLDHHQTQASRGSITEIRSIAVASAGLIKGHKKFANFQTVVRVRLTIINKGQETTTQRYFITSLPPNARRLSLIIKGHWSIEGVLHWYLDVSFEEDYSKAKKDNSPLNANVLRKIALSLLLPKKQGRVSLQKMMFRAAMENEYLEMVLFGM